MSENLYDVFRFSGIINGVEQWITLVIGCLEIVADCSQTDSRTDMGFIRSL